MFALLFGQLAGLTRSILVAGLFGASPELDAFSAANRVSETLFLLVAGGALGSAFIPTFTGLLARAKKDSAWRLASALANAVFLTLSLLAILLAVFAPQVVRYALAPGFARVDRWHPQRASGLSYPLTHAFPVTIPINWAHLS
jgi:putative peptidoglycan lipid II flippase